MNISNILGFIGMCGIGAMALLFVGSLAIGLLLGGRDPGVRTAMGLSAGNRNGSAALLVATLNFAGTDTLPFVLVGIALSILILLPAAKLMGARSQPSAAPVTPAE